MYCTPMNSVCGCWYQPAPLVDDRVHYSPEDEYPGHQYFPYHQYVPKQYLPLLESEVHSTILSTASRTVLKQTFKNPSTTEPIKECTYTFPLYDGVGVVSFTCRVGEKVLHGLVKEKAKAKEMFDTAVARGETAGLLQQAPEASDVFSTKLGNIPAGESVIVEIVYIGELKHHETEGIRFTIPTQIAPRYGPGPDYGASGVTAQSHGGIQITVDINMPEGSLIKGVQSPSHPIAVSMGTVSTAVSADPMMTKASATLSLGSAELEKDFVLIVQSKDVGIPMAILETHPTIPNHRALMVTLVPKFSLPPSRPEIVFVADRSGSMEANIPMLISAMNVFLKSTPAGVKFNICSFGTGCSFLWKKNQSYTKDTLQQAIAHVQTFSADMGGTETFLAIKATIDRCWSDLPLEIILLTDGDIQSQTELFDYVNQQVDESKGKIRVFPLAIGNGVSHALTEGLARAGNGFSQAVQNGERLDNSVVRMLRGALTPHITDYTLEVKYGKDDDGLEAIEKVTEGLKVMLADSQNEKSLSKDKAIISLFDNSADPEKGDIKGVKDSDHYLPKVPTPKLLQAPYKIPSLFAFCRTSVYLLMSADTYQRKPTAVLLRATSEHRPLELEIPIEVLECPGETIHQLAAKKAVQDLEEGRGWIFDAKNQEGILLKDVCPSSVDDFVKREAVRLGEQFQIVGKWCSFVAVATNDKDIADKAKQGSDEMDHEYEMIDEAANFQDQYDEYPKSHLRAELSSLSSNLDSSAFYQTRSALFDSGKESGALLRRSNFVMGSLRSSGGSPPAPVSDLRRTAATSPEQIYFSSASYSRFARYSMPATVGTCPISSPAFAVPSSIAGKVLALIDLQDFDGFWATDSNKHAFLIMDIADTTTPDEASPTVWLTILVIKFLQEKCAEEQGTWMLVVEKAQAWLDGCGALDIEDLGKKATLSLLG